MCGLEIRLCGFTTVTRSRWAKALYRFRKETKPGELPLHFSLDPEVNKMVSDSAFLRPRYLERKRGDGEGRVYPTGFRFPPLHHGDQELVTGIQKRAKCHCGFTVVAFIIWTNLADILRASGAKDLGSDDSL